MKSPIKQRAIAERADKLKCGLPVESVPADGTADPWLRRPAAAKHLGISTSLLEKLDALGDGPPSARIGRSRIYRRSHLDKYAEQRLVNPAT